MDHYKAVVMDYLRADTALFVNADCSIQVGKPKTSERDSPHCHCDAVAIDLRHRAAYLCEISWKMQALLKKLGTWASHWESIRSVLHQNCKVPADWRIHVWLFVPKDSIEMLDEKLEELRRTSGSPFKVKITALEDVQPWRYWTWDRSDSEAEETAPKPIHA